MSNSVSLQADVGNIPSNSVALLSSLSPLLKALSSDNVSPLAVVQMEAIGACFHINGPFAEKVPELLMRSSSMRLQRLSVMVGWMKGDTASALAQTAGGRAAALLSLGLVELFGDDTTGAILYNVSSKVLHNQQNHSSMVQLHQVAKTLSNKLRSLAFGSHLAVHVTRIREVYLNSSLEIPSSFLDSISPETMTDLLAMLHTALVDETSILYVEGSRGLGYIVAFIMALCPNNTTVIVKDIIIFQGERRSVYISIKCNTPTHFGLETVLHDGKRRSEAIVSAKKGKKSSHLNFKWEGCLSDILDLALIRISSSSTPDLRLHIVQLITSMVYSLSELDFQGPVSDFGSKSDLPRGGFKVMLGENQMSRILDRIALLFRTQPSVPSFDCVLAYESLRASINNLIPSKSCTTSQCFHLHYWEVSLLPDRRHSLTCKVPQLWRDIIDLIGVGILMLFVEHDADVCIGGSISPKMAIYITNAIMRCYFRCHNIDMSVIHPSVYTIADLHVDICNIIASASVDFIGISNGAFSIFPSSIERPAICTTQILTYLAVHGQYFDRQGYYRTLTSEGPSRKQAQKSITDHKEPIGPSGVGSHTSLTVSLRPQLDQLIIRTMVEFSGTTFELNFLHLHFAYMGLSYSAPCVHSPRDTLDPDNSIDIITTSLANPSGLEEKIYLVLTHGNPEAQFLCGNWGTRTLFQGNSCLNCVIKDARQNEFRMVIQS